MNTDRLPKDLPGGWDHNDTFQEAPLKVGLVWRKTGRVDALKLVRVMMSDHPENDGGAQGIRIRPTVIGTGARIKSCRKTWLCLGDGETIKAAWLFTSSVGLIGNERSRRYPQNVPCEQ